MSVQGRSNGIPRIEQNTLSYFTYGSAQQANCPCDYIVIGV